MREYTIHQLSSLLESIFFVCGEPVTRKKLEKLTQCSKEDLDSALVELESRYESKKSGLSLVEKDDTLILVTKSRNAPIIEKLVRKDIDTPLSSNLMEVLSVVAYRAPVSKQEIDYIRGVNSLSALRNLMIRGLIERIDHPENNKTFLYRPTSLFLESIGLTSLKKLPDYDELQKDSRLLDNKTENA